MSLLAVFEKMLDIQLNKTETDFLENTIREVCFLKGEIPVMEGDIMDSFYFVVKGVVRGYYLDENGSEVTKCFSRENQFFSSECFRTGLPSTFNIECIENCQCIQVPYAIVRANEQVAAKINILYVKEIERLEKRVRSMLVMNAEERYQSFCKEYETIKNRIPLKYVASYIGIDPASLSRIRNKIGKN